MSLSPVGTDHVIVVGAGMIGLSTAWYLQERGVKVTVVDRKGVAAGSSWGNAGWLTPALTLPLGEPSLLLSGPWQLVKPSSPLYVPPSPRLIPFLVGFAWHSLPRQWKKSIAIFAKVNPLAMDAFHELAAGGVKEPVTPAAPFLAGFRAEKDRAGLLHEFEVVEASGGTVDYDLVSGDELRAIEPTLADGVQAGVLLRGQYFINPPKCLESLGAVVKKRGAEIITDFEVTDVNETASGVEVLSKPGKTVTGDTAVIATGAWLSSLARKFGIKAIVQAGRGYSFSVKPEVIPSHPIYFPTQRVACTPLGDRLRVGGQPVTADGHALIGQTKSSRVYVGGGHGMWGIALGPLAGKLLAGSITGSPDPVLEHFDPLR